MAGTVGKLIVTLTARTGKFRKGLGKAGSMVKNFASSMAGMAKKVLKFGAVMATAAVVGIAFFTKKAFESIDATAKLAKQIGISIDGLRGLNRAAEITGASAEDVTKAVGVFGKTLGEAAVKGIGLGKDALDALNLSAKDLIELPVDESIAIVADEMNKLGTQAEKAFVASKLFGRGGLALVNTLALGSKGLKEMADGAKILQGSLTAFDAAKVELANDAITDMRSTWTALFERIAIATAPIVKDIADNFTKLFIWIRENASTIFPQVIEWFKTMVFAAGEMTSGIIDRIRQVPDAIRIMSIEMFRIWSTTLIHIRKETTTFMAIFETGWEGIGMIISDIWANIQISFLKAIRFIGNTIVGFARWLSDVLPGENEWIDNIIKGHDQGFKLIEETMDRVQTKSQERWAGFWDANAQGAKTLTNDMANMQSELDILNKSLTGAQAAVLTGRDSGKGWAVAIENIIDKVRSIKLPSVTEAFAEGGKLAGESLTKTVKAITTPAAIEKGTVEAFSATVKSTYANLADSGKRTVTELQKSNRLQTDTNRLLEATATETVGIA